MSSTQKPVPNSAEVEAVSQALLEADCMTGETSKRRERAAWFVDHHGGVGEVRLLIAHAERKTTREDPGGLLRHWLHDGQYMKEILHVLRHQQKNQKVGRHGDAPAMDLPRSPKAMARAAGYGDDTEKWQLERAQKMMWTRWLHERKHLPYDERLADIAAEFGMDEEDVYEVLSEAAVMACRYDLEVAEARLAAAEGDESNRKLRRDPACLADLRTKVEEAKAAVETVKGLQDWHDQDEKRKAELRKRIGRKVKP